MSEAQNPENTNESGEGEKRVSMAEFITAWETVVASENPSVQAVADQLGLKKESVGQRASNYRSKKGIALSEMPRGGSRLNAKAGNDLVAKIKAELAAKAAEAENQETSEESAEA